MAETETMDRGLPDPPIPGNDDKKVEWAVLTFLLDEHPDHHLTTLELALALNGGTSEFSEEDAVERAVRELVGAGLLHCRSGFVLPTRAALCFRRLER